MDGRLAVNTTSTDPDDLETALRAYADAGFDGVEFNAGHVRPYLDGGHTVEDVRALLDSYGLDCVGGVGGQVACFGDVAADNDDVRENADLIAALGGDVVVVGADGPGGSPGPAVLGEYAEALGTLADLVKPTVCIEFNWGPTLRTLRSAAEVVRRADHPNLRALFDPAHYYCTPTKFAELTAGNVGTLGHVHLDDMPPIPGELADVNWDRVLPGEGCLDLPAMVERIESEYGGYYSVEMFDEELQGLPQREAAERLYSSMEGIL
ncbi:MAG: sugar phosphate isomerase/epimerase family protein [Halobacteriaceae archaeon]